MPSKIAEYLGSDEFLASATRHVKEAIAKAEAHGLPAAYSKRVSDTPAKEEAVLIPRPELLRKKPPKK